jgi:hypothetical protein
LRPSGEDAEKFVERFGYGCAVGPELSSAECECGRDEQSSAAVDGEDDQLRRLVAHARFGLQVLTP